MQRLQHDAHRAGQLVLHQLVVVAKVTRLALLFEPVDELAALFERYDVYRTGFVAVEDFRRALSLITRP